MVYVIAEPCIGTKDTACVDVCPVDCIHPRKDEPEFEKMTMLYIHPEECIDCGACVPECPVNAIFEVNSVPDKWKSYVVKNRAPFQANAGLPKAIPQDKWEAQRRVTGSRAYQYYRKYGKSPRVAPEDRQ